MKLNFNIKKSTLILVTAILCGVVLSFAAYIQTKGYEQDTILTQFNHDVQKGSDFIEGSIVEKLLILEAIRNSHNVTGDFSRDDFTLCANTFLDHYGDFHALGWIPRVPDEERIACETLAREDGFENFEIKEWTEDGEILRAAEQDEYYPIYYIEPFQGHETLLGLNLGVSEDFETSYAFARDNNLAGATSLEYPVESQQHEGVIRIYLPVYQNDGITYTEAGRRLSHLGFVYGGFMMHDLIADLSREIPQFETMTVKITDITDPSRPVILYDQNLEADTWSVAGNALRLVQNASFAGMTWEIEIKGMQAYIEDHKSANAIWVLLAGLVLTFLLSYYLYTLNTRNIQMEEEVAARTFQLKVHASQQAAVARFGQEAITGISLTELFEHAVKIVGDELESQCAVLLKYVDKEHVFQQTAIRCDCPHKPTFQNISDDKGSIEGYTLARSEPVIVNTNIPAISDAVELSNVDEMVNNAIAASVQGQKGPFGILISYDVSDTGYKIEDANFVQSIANILADAIERKHGDDALEQSETRARTLIDATNDGVVLLDDVGTILHTNHTYAHRHQMTTSSLFGTNVWDLFTKDLAEINYDHFSQVFRTGQPVRVVEARQGLWYDSTIYPIKDTDGNVIQAAVYARDITEQKSAEQRIQRLAMIVEQASEGICYADLGGTIKFVNQSWIGMHGYDSADELIGNHISMFHTEQQVRDEVKPFNELVVKNGQHTGEVGHVRKDGATFQSEMRVTLLKDENDQPIGLIGFMVDITERKRIEDDRLRLQVENQHAQKMTSIGELAAGIAHEINTPTQYVGDNTRFLQDSFKDLSTVMDQFTGLLKACKDDVVTDELVSNVEKACEDADIEYLFEEIPTAIEQTLEGTVRVASIVRAMKEFSHPGSDNKTPVDLNRALETTITISRNEWKYVSDVETDFDTTLPFVECMPGDVNQGFLNMITNAAHAIQMKEGREETEKGVIRVSTRNLDDMVEIRITDTGGGIPEAIRAQIFDPFFTTKEVGKGTGQGLTITYDIFVNKHGGTITFESEEGVGTTFIIQLPVNAPEIESAEDDTDAAVEDED